MGKRRWMPLCDIENWANIPDSTEFGHAIGIVIGHGVHMGENCFIRQGVTIGDTKRSKGDYPHLGSNVDIGANSTIIGKIHIGNNVVIGAHSFINKDIPDNCTVYSKNEIIIRLNDERTEEATQDP